MGKGSNPRPVDATKYRENWDRIFAKVTEAGQHYRDALDELTQLHQFTYRALQENGDEMLWVSSMPCGLPTDETIPLARQDLTLAGLGLSGDLLTAANATTALGLVETALATATSRMAALGAESKRIDQHLVFVSKLADTLETGIGQLVDADLAKESARLQALQVQQQLGAQALSIANSAPQIVLSLFRNG